MNKDLITIATPEEEELAEKKRELERLSEVLAGKELDLEDLKLAVARFQHRYFSEVGKKYVQLDELRAQIAELKAGRAPQNSALKREAETARQEAAKSAEEYQNIRGESEPPAGKEEASDDTKKLYRKIASMIHPDKSTDEKSRQLRTRLMAELNAAYACRETARMQAILAEWQHSPDSVPGEGTGAELVRTIRAIAQVKRGITGIEKAISEMIASDIQQLMVKVHEADLAGRNILLEMAKSLDLEIGQAEDEVATLRR